MKRPLPLDAEAKKMTGDSPQKVEDGDKEKFEENKALNFFEKGKDGKLVLRESFFEKARDSRLFLKKPGFAGGTESLVQDDIENLNEQLSRSFEYNFEQHEAENDISPNKLVRSPGLTNRADLGTKPLGSGRHWTLLHRILPFSRYV